MHKAATIWIPFVVATLSCGTGSDPDNSTPSPEFGPCERIESVRACVAHVDCDWAQSCVEHESGALPELALRYDGEAVASDGSALPVDLRFMSDTTDSRALMRVGSTDAGWGYSVDLRLTPAGAVLLDTSDARCADDACNRGALQLDGQLDDAAIEITQVGFRAGLGSELPFVSLRFVPHDGVKPVLEPRVELPYDPAPVAGVYAGDVYALADRIFVESSCELQLSGDPLTAPLFRCEELSGTEPSGVSWDAERSLLNVVVGPAEDRYLLVAELSLPVDGTLDGVIADMPMQEAPVAPEDVGFEALVGTVRLVETGN